jgi:hypothetical protein
MASISDFKNNFNGGTRANRFYISGSFPGGSFTKFHVIATNIPAVVSKEIIYDHFGRKWRYPGEKEYAAWTFTVLDDYEEGNSTSSVNLWKQFHSWQNLINDHETNESYILNTNRTYKADGWDIYHLGINGENTTSSTGAKPLKRFTLNGCWPTKIQGPSFTMNRNQLNSFTVTVVFDDIEIGGVTKSSENGAGLPLSF